MYYLLGFVFCSILLSSSFVEAQGISKEQIERQGIALFSVDSLRDLPVQDEVKVSGQVEEILSDHSFILKDDTDRVIVKTSHVSFRPFYGEKLTIEGDVEPGDMYREINATRITRENSEVIEIRRHRW